jgi:hypothetical protein
MLQHVALRGRQAPLLGFAMLADVYVELAAFTYCAGLFVLQEKSSVTFQFV